VPYRYRLRQPRQRPRTNFFRHLFFKLKTLTTLFWRALYFTYLRKHQCKNDVIVYLFPDIAKHHNILNLFSMPKRRLLHQRNNLDFYLSRLRWKQLVTERLADALSCCNAPVMLSRPGLPRPRPRPTVPRPRPPKSGLDRSRDRDQVSRPTSLILHSTNFGINRIITIIIISSILT
jgi:hypothetical protein